MCVGSGTVGCGESGLVGCSGSCRVPLPGNPLGFKFDLPALPTCCRKFEKIRASLHNNASNTLYTYAV